MKFRDLPILERKSEMIQWPPEWSSAYQPKERWPRGEIGTLEDAWMHKLLDQCVFLHIRHDGLAYTGSMYFDNVDSCMMVFSILKSVMGRSIAEIGDLDISYLL